jgi:hypothetical protein
MPSSVEGFSCGLLAEAELDSCRISAGRLWDEMHVAMRASAGRSRSKSYNEAFLTKTVDFRNTTHRNDPPPGTPGKSQLASAVT